MRFVTVVCHSALLLLVLLLKKFLIIIVASNKAKVVDFRKRLILDKKRVYLFIYLLLGQM